MRDHFKKCFFPKLPSMGHVKLSILSYLKHSEHYYTRDNRIWHHQYHRCVHLLTLISFNESDCTHCQVTQYCNVPYHARLQIHIPDSWIEVSTNNSITNYPTCSQPDSNNTQPALTRTSAVKKHDSTQQKYYYYVYKHCPRCSITYTPYNLSLHFTM